MGNCWLDESHRPTAETIHAFLCQVQKRFQTKELQEQSEFDTKWDQAAAKDQLRKGQGQDVELQNMAASIDPLDAEMPDINSSQNANTVREKYLHIEPNVIVSHSTPKKSVYAGERAKVHQAGLFPKDSSVIPMEPESVLELPTRPDQQTINQTGNSVGAVQMKNSDMFSYQQETDSSKSSRSQNHIRETSDVPELVTTNAQSGVEKKNLPNSKDSDTNVSFNSLIESDDSVVILGGSGLHDDFDLSPKKTVSPLPSNTATPSKKPSMSSVLTSTPLPKVTPTLPQENTSVYLSASSNQVTQNNDGTKFFTAENTPREEIEDKEFDNKAMDGQTEIQTNVISKPVECTSEGSPRREPHMKTMSPRILSEEMTLNGVVENGDFSQELEKRTRADSEQSTEEGNDDIDDSKSDEEKLKLLKLTLTSALSTETEGPDGDKDAADSGSNSPVRDELEIAREIYMSRGTTIPGTTHTTPRSLNTIPEDAIPIDIPIPTRIPSEGDSVRSTPTRLALKFDDPSEEFSGTASDIFEWDDYISEELQLVGDVKDFENSPRQTMEFPEWSLDNDSSSQESDSKALNKADANDSASSATESRPGSRASSIGTPYSTSESEVKSPAGIAARSYIKDLLAKRSSTHTSSNYTTKSILNKPSFYALSHTYDLDSSEHVSSDSEPSSSPVSMTNGDGAFMDEWDL